MTFGFSSVTPLFLPPFLSIWLYKLNTFCLILLTDVNYLVLRLNVHTMNNYGLIGYLFD